MDVLNLSELDAAERIVEASGDGARFTVFRNDIFLAGVKVVDLADG